MVCMGWGLGGVKKVPTHQVSEVLLGKAAQQRCLGSEGQHKGVLRERSRGATGRAPHRPTGKPGGSNNRGRRAGLEKQVGYRLSSRKETKSKETSCLL